MPSDSSFCAYRSSLTLSGAVTLFARGAVDVAAGAIPEVRTTTARTDANANTNLRRTGHPPTGRGADGSSRSLSPKDVLRVPVERVAEVSLHEGDREVAA